jgi:hypothetical protein
MVVAVAVKLYQISSFAPEPAQDGALADGLVFWVEAIILKLQVEFQFWGVMEMAFVQSSFTGWVYKRLDAKERHNAIKD